MTKIALAVMMLFMFSFGANTEGFRDIKFGDSPLKDMVLEKHDKATNIKHYALKKDKFNIGEATLDSISYWYFDNKFMGSFMHFTGRGNFNLLKETLESKHGEPYRPNRYMDNYMWTGGNTRLAITYSDVRGSGMIMLMNIEMSNMSDAYKKDIAAKGASDL